MQCIARLEAHEGYAPPQLVDRTEVLAENRFIAARDGHGGSASIPTSSRGCPATAVLDSLLEACAPHARELGCEAELEPLVRGWPRPTGARRQLNLARGAERLPGPGRAPGGLFAEERPRPDEQPGAVGELPH